MHMYRPNRPYSAADNFTGHWSTAQYIPSPTMAKASNKRTSAAYRYVHTMVIHKNTSFIYSVQFHGDGDIYNVKLMGNTTIQVTRCTSYHIGHLTAQELHILKSIMEGAAELKTIGDTLGFLETDLTLVQQSHMLIPQGSKGFFREMLSKWLKWGHPNHCWPTLEALENALQSSGQESLAFKPSSLQKEGKGSG